MLNDILKETRDKMKSSLAFYEDELSGIRSGRASTALVDRLIVEYYGQETELRQLANISTPEALQILIRPYDKSAVQAIERAISPGQYRREPQCGWREYPAEHATTDRRTPSGPG